MTEAPLRSIRPGDVTECPVCKGKHDIYRDQRSLCPTCWNTRLVIWQLRPAGYAPFRNPASSRPPLDDLTQRQRQVLHAIIVYGLANEGRSPSMQDLRGALQLRSSSTVSTHLSNLAAKGYLTLRRFTARSIQLVK